MKGTTVAATDADAEVRTNALGRATLVIAATASVLSALDLFVVNVAFSSLRESFPGTTNQTLSWVLSAYSILFAAVLVPAGRLADRFGRKRVFRLGLAVFATASATCAVAPSVAVLVAARAIEGIGAAMMVPTSLGLLLAAHPRERHQQMVAIWGAAGAVAAGLGPVLGGVLVEATWRLVFLLNVPVAVIAIWRSARLVDDDHGRAETTRPDLVGSVALVGGIAALVGSISWAPRWAFASAQVTAMATGAVGLLAWFFWRCTHHPSPALDLRIFRARAFLAATVGMGVFYAGFAMMLLGATLFLGSVWGWSAMQSGGGIALGPLMATVSSLVASRRRLPAVRLAVMGAVCFVAASLWWWMRLGSDVAWASDYLPALVLYGVGAGIAQIGFLSRGTAALPAVQYATGSAVLNTSRQIGAAVGVAVFVALSGDASAPSQFETAWLVVGASAAVAGLVLVLWTDRDAT